LEVAGKARPAVISVTTAFPISRATAGPTAAATDPATDLVAALTAVLPADRVVTDPVVLASYAHDEAEWAEHVLPVAAVRPRTAEEVQAVVRACIEHRTPVVPRGAGTGLSGGANATVGWVVLSLEAMDAVLEVDALELFAVVQPGVVNDDLRAHVAGHGPGTHRTRRARPGRPSAGTWPPMPVACAA
jgi:glycolate oxidase